MKACFTSAEQIREVLDLYEEGFSSIALASYYGVSKPTILKLVKKEGITRGSREYSLNESAFDTITEESAYWIGFLMADGCVRQSSRRSILSLKLQLRDVEHLNKFRKFLDTDKPLYFEERKYNILGQGGGQEKWYQSIRSEITSRKLVSALKRYGVTPKKSLTAKVIGLEENRHFWRGVVDGDGLIGIYGKSQQPEVALWGSYYLLSQFITFVRKLVDCHMTFAPDGKTSNTYRARTSGWGVTPIILKTLYGDSNIFLDRKKEIYNDIIEKYSLKNDTTNMRNVA